MSDTPAHRRYTQRAAAWLAVGLCAAGVAQAAPARIDARVVWLRGDLFYLAAADSLALEPGAHLTLTVKDRTVAEGEVVEVLDRAMARGRITRGAIRDPKHLERLAVLAEPPRGRGMLRVGYPASGRGPDPEGCAGRTLAVDSTAARVESVGRAVRIIRLSGVASAWPETLLVQPFADAADEEIALERGELDVAVFWPGERSRHLRDDPRWREPLSWPPGASGPASAVVCDPALRARVAAIGARAFVGLYRCAGASR